MIDSHVHLDHPAFGDDFEEVVARAVEDGVSALVNVGYDPASARATAGYVRNYPFFFGIVGTHPHDASGHDGKFEDDLERLLDEPRVLAVGEIGLDFYYDHSPRDVQKDVFRRLLRLAIRKNKPVVIHCRDAHQEALDILEAERSSYRGIFHAFSGDADTARRVVRLGFHLGVGGVATYKNSRLLENIRMVPKNRLVLETDCPYLTPHPFRGRRNEPALIRLVVETLARAFSASPDEIIQLTTGNFLDAMGITKKTLPPSVYKIGDKVYSHTAPEASPEDLADAAGEIIGSGNGVREAVICGHTDPSGHLGQVMALGARFKQLGVPVRLMVGAGGYAAPVRGTKEIKSIARLVDAVTVRLYGGNAAQHEKIFKAGRGEKSFESLIKFVNISVAARVPTECQFVAVPKVNLEPCRALAHSLGAGFSVRKYRSL